MAYYSPRDPGFWDLEPEFLRPVQDACKPFDINVLHFVLGDPDDEHTPVAAMLKLPPGGVLARHSHPVVRFEVLVQGSIEVEGRTLLPGDVMVSPAGEFYGPHVAGPEGATTVEVFSSIKGTGNLLYETDEGVQPASYR